MKNKKILVLVAAILCVSSPLISCASDKVPEKDNTVISEEVNDTRVESNEESYELEVINGDRVFKSEIVPDSKPKELAIDYLKVNITDDYSQFSNLFTDNNDMHESINGLEESNKNNLDNNLYTKEIVVHNVNYLTSDELEEIKDSGFMEGLNEINPYKYEVVKVNYTIKQNDEFDKIAQFSSGEYTYYCGVIMENEDSDWKIYTAAQC